MSFWSGMISCNSSRHDTPPDAGRNEPADEPGDEPGDSQRAARRRMVAEQLVRRDISDGRVLEALGRVPREHFVPVALQHQAYMDHPLPIGLDQTISQPYIVALMTQIVRPTPETRALDIGVGSGYQAAVLAELCSQVYGVEIIESLASAAGKRLAALGYLNVVVRHGDGHSGWPEHAPFDVIVVGPRRGACRRAGRISSPSAAGWRFRWVATISSCY